MFLPTQAPCHLTPSPSPMISSLLTDGENQCGEEEKAEEGEEEEED
ncbi:hypothetical protein EYF80_061745 [Liparis tanakae]|uniref:Uncharacterized protein n=1 Tax=Liparis tanakae TaxID=230148 RepID=A0A4Z2EGX1_9TELE|nr:hypothetical protein EYF80_061745 [Liparis tanakae]